MVIKFLVVIMRSADAITLFRTLLVFPIAYAILARFDPFITIFFIAVMILLDVADGYAAVNETSSGKIGLIEYIRAVSGNKKAKEKVSKYKSLIKKQSIYGARMDIAGDRVTEYVFWIVFTYVNIVPLWVLFLIVLRHSFVDAVMGAKGTSSKMKSGFAKLVYSSPLGRGGIGIVKFVTFSYLVLVYVSGYPVVVGYVLIAILFGYIMLRGIAELYEAFYA
jgi:phosphatidylglycerophosphate synthase